MSSEQKFASLDPDDAGEGKALFDEGDVEFTHAAVEIFDYRGQSEPATGVRLKMRGLAPNAEGEIPELDEFYRFDTPDKFVPSADNKRVIPVSDDEEKQKLWAKCDGVQLMKALADSGVSRTLLKAGDISVLQGAKFRVIRVNKKDKNGALVKNKKGYAVTLIVPSKLIAMPGEKAAGKTAAKSTAAKTAAPAASSNGAVDLSTVSDDLRERTIGYIVDAVSKAPVAKKGIAGAVFPLAMKAASAKEISGDDLKLIGKLVFDEGFLTANSGQPVQRGEDIIAFTYDSGSGQISRAA
jgi:hypothetical protein